MNTLSSSITFNSTSLHAKKHKTSLLKQFSEIIESGIFLQGKQNEQLEKKLQKYFGIGNIITVASGHDALLLAIAALNLKPDDEVIIPVNSYPTVFPIAQSDVKIVLADVDNNGQLSAKDLKKKITKKTKAVVLVHLYGLVGDLEEIITICKKRKIYLIEDCAQAFGTSYKKKKVGTFGDISCFSFYPTKNLGTLGDGGAIWTKHKNIYNFLHQAKAYGEKKRYKSNFVSGHSRMPEIQASIINIYLNSIEEETRKRKRIYNLYKKHIQKKGLTPYIQPLESHPNSSTATHLFVVTAKNRNALQKHLYKHGVPTLIHYPHLIHQLPAFSFLDYKKGHFPLAEKLNTMIISLPFHTYLLEKEITYITDVIQKFYA